MGHIHIGPKGRIHSKQPVEVAPSIIEESKGPIPTPRYVEVYIDRPAETIIKETIKHIEIPIEQIKYVNKIIEVPVEKIVYVPVDVLVEKVIKTTTNIIPKWMFGIIGFEFLMILIMYFK
jgi:hypothetical protein